MMMNLEYILGMSAIGISSILPNPNWFEHFKIMIRSKTTKTNS